MTIRICESTIVSCALFYFYYCCYISFILLLSLLSLSPSIFLLGPPSNVFFSTSAYFVNSKILSSCLIWQIISFVLTPNKQRWLCIRLNNTEKYCAITLKIMIMLQNVCENCVQILEEEKHHQLWIFVILWKHWKNLASSSINQSVKSQKQCVHPRILLLWQKVCVKRLQHQLTVVLNNWTFRRHHWDEFFA